MKTYIFSSGISLLFVLFLSLQVEAQPCDNGISTDPYNPINNQFIQIGNDLDTTNGTTDTYNPWLNQFNWYWGQNTITLYPNEVNWVHEFSNQNNNILMQHPYGGSMPTEFQYLRPNNVNPNFRDFRWEDGWELLYMNLGYFPDLNHINDPAAGSYYANHGQSYNPLPSNIPYFVIYNLYRGLMRLFANVWYPVDGNYSNINVTLKFTKTSGDNELLTGLLRHASAYDVAISEKTIIKAIHAPRFHAPNYTQWIVADFQMTYDPCSCQSQGELEFVFTAFNTLEVDIIGRSISLEVPINDTTYTTRDFLNMSDINVDEYVPGTEIYQNMDRLAEQFEKKQLKYLEDLEEYNQYNPFALALQKFGVKQAAKYLSGGLSSILISDSLLTWVTNDDWKEATTLEDLPIGIEPQNVKNKFADKAKGLIGETFGFLSTEIFSPEPTNKPTPPAVPVATLEESVYKGTISAIDTTYSSPLVLPGSLPHAYPSGTTLEPHRLPVYNEVLGLAALLKTPSLFTEDFPVFFNSDILYVASDSWQSSFEFQMRFGDDLDIILNPVLDIDYGKTKTYVNLELILERYSNEEITHDFNISLDDQTNFNLSHILDQGYKTEAKLVSQWVPLEDLNQYVFVLNMTDTFIDEDVDGENQGLLRYKVKALKMKLMHDMFFDQVGSSNENINTTHIRSYYLMNFNENPFDVSQLFPNPLPGIFDLYQTGLMILDNEIITTNHPFVHEVIGMEIFINAEEVHIIGPLLVQPGYTLIIQALEQILQMPGAVVSPNIQLNIKQDFYNTPVFEYADNTKVASFCGSTNYQANIDAAAISTNNGSQNRETKKELTKVVDERGSIQLFPNPARDLLTLRSSHLDMSAITIYDLPGKPIKQQNLQAHLREAQINLSGIAPGTYIVRVNCGDEVFSEKLIVTK